jgi:phosphoglycolate phosphatase-like HAD superfamily hydrolase
MIEESESLLNVDLNKKQKIIMIWRIISLFLLIILAVIVILYALGIGWKQKEDKKDEGDNYESILSLWQPGSTVITKLIPYIKSITNKNNQDFIPVEDRIAVFDLDGTLFCETDPIYFDWNMFAYRILDDPVYNKTAIQSDIDLANKIRGAYIHKLPEGLEKEHCVRNAAVFKGMSMEEYIDYTKKFLNGDSPGYNNLKRKDAFYKPMLQVIEYLQKYEFTVYIVSGTDRFEVRTIVQGHINIPESQIIGSISTIRSINQGDKEGIDYQFEKNDSVVLGGEFIIKNVKMNKISTIQTEIGKKPVLSFGNSSGDKSMSNYVVYNNPYKSLAFMLLCDDETRENGNKTRADDMARMCTEYNWQPISMESDWKTIYGDDVTRRKNL